MYRTHLLAIFFSIFVTVEFYASSPSAVCARCGLVQYCSRECQKRDWKQHKIECSKSVDDGDAALYKKLQWRIEQFENFYTPIIHRLVLDLYRLYNKAMNNDDILFPENAIVEIQLADLPQSAKRPRLYIKQVLVAELSQYEMEAVYSSGNTRLEPGFAYVRHCMSYKTGSGEDDYFTKYYQFQYRVDPDERSEFKRASKKMYNENLREHQDFINSVAKGEKPKVYKVIKDVLKEKHG